MRRQRILVTLAAVVVGVILLQDPARADCVGPTLAVAATPAANEGSPPPVEDDAARARWIAAGMVIAAAAIGGLLVLSKR